MNSRHMWLLSVAACGLVVGCGTPTLTEVPESERELRAIAVLYGNFQGAHKGQPPANEKAFKKYVQGLSADQRESFGIKDVDGLFVSPRDSQPYVINYGQAAGPPGVPGSGDPTKSVKVGPGSGAGANPMQRVIAYEKNGADGQRYVAFSNSDVELVDEARFRELVK